MLSGLTTGEASGVIARVPLVPPCGMRSVMSIHMLSAEDQLPSGQYGVTTAAPLSDSSIQSPEQRVVTYDLDRSGSCSEGGSISRARRFEHLPDFTHE